MRDEAYTERKEGVFLLVWMWSKLTKDIVILTLLIFFKTMLMIVILSVIFINECFYWLLHAWQIYFTIPNFSFQNECSLLSSFILCSKTEGSYEPHCHCCFCPACARAIIALACAGNSCELLNLRMYLLDSLKNGRFHNTRLRNDDLLPSEVLRSCFLL